MAPSVIRCDRLVCMGQTDCTLCFSHCLRAGDHAGDCLNHVTKSIICLLCVVMQWAHTSGTVIVRKAATHFTSYLLFTIGQHTRIMCVNACIYILQQKGIIIFVQLLITKLKNPKNTTDRSLQLFCKSIDF